MPLPDDHAVLESTTRLGARDYTRTGLTWFGFAQAFLLVSLVFSDGPEADEGGDISLIEIALGLGGVATLAVLGVLVLGVLADRSADIPLHVRNRRLSDQQAAWIMLVVAGIAEVAFATLSVSAAVL